MNMLVLFIFGTFSFGLTPPTSKEAVKTAVPLVETSEVTLKVNGMVCSFCAQGIEKKLGKHKSVKHLNVDLDGKKVVIRFKKNKNISDAELKTTLKNSGYDVVGIERALVSKTGGVKSKKGLK